MKKVTPKHIIIKMLKTRKKEKSLKTVREKLTMYMEFVIYVDVKHITKIEVYCCKVIKLYVKWYNIM